MFNLDTALDVKFGTAGNLASISATYPNGINFSENAIFSGTFGSFFEVVTGGTTTPTDLVLGDFDGQIGNNQSVEHFQNEILIIPAASSQNGTAYVSNMVSVINAISTTGASSTLARPGITGFTTATIRRLCVASVDPNNSLRIILIPLTRVTTNLGVVSVRPNVTAQFSDGISNSLSDERISMASFSDNRTFSASDLREIEVVYTKPLNAIFIYLPTPQSVENKIASIALTKPNGEIVALNDFVDGTNGLTQSGYLYWKPERDVYDNVQADQLYTLSINYSNIIVAVFGGINILFCDKFDLLREYPDLDNLLSISDEKTITPQLIRIMESTMLEIEKKVQNSPFWKEDRQYHFTAKQLNRWDLLQINEINQAAIFWTLAKIFYFLSDTPGDIYSSKASDYRARGESAFASVNLSLDFNDNGSLDVFEGEREAANIEITFER